MSFEVQCDKCGQSCAAHDTIFEGNRRVCDDCDTKAYKKMIEARNWRPSDKPPATKSKGKLPPPIKLTTGDYAFYSAWSIGMLAFFYLMTIVWP